MRTIRFILISVLIEVPMMIMLGDLGLIATVAVAYFLAYGREEAYDGEEIH